MTLVTPTKGPALWQPRRGPELMFGRIADRPEARAIREWSPKSDLAKALKAGRALLPEELFNELFATISRSMVYQSRLVGVLIHEGQLGRVDKVEFLGTLSEKVVTTAGVAYLADVMDATLAGGGCKYHGFGTGGGAEAIGDVQLTTELTTEYAVDNTRPTGTQSSPTNTYVSTGTLAPDSGGAIAITEHCIANSSARNGAPMFDRSLFGAVTVTAGADSLAVTYTGTFTAGG